MQEQTRFSIGGRGGSQSVVALWRVRDGSRLQAQNKSYDHESIFKKNQLPSPTLKQHCQSTTILKIPQDPNSSQQLSKSSSPQHP